MILTFVYLITARVQQLQTLYPHLPTTTLIWLDETQAFRRHAGWPKVAQYKTAPRDMRLTSTHL